MILTTPRLIIRPATSAINDLTALTQILADEQVNQYLPWYPVTTLAATKRFYDEKIARLNATDQAFFWLICLKTTQQPIGYIDLSDDAGHDLGYGLAVAYWHQGIATEAGTAVIDYLRMTSLPFITATHDRHNVGSGKVMQKLGMQYAYSYEEQWQPKDILVTFRLYQLNLDGQTDRIYWHYWDQSETHMIEKMI